MKITKKTGIIIGSSIVVIVVLGFLLVPKKPKEALQIVDRGDVVEAAYGVGTVKSDKTYNLKAGSSNHVLKRFVRQGQAVKKGDSLIQMDSVPVFKAPFDGVVSNLAYDEGEVVLSSNTIMTITNLDSLFLRLSMDERTIGGVKTGQLARISFEGQRGTLIEGTVRSVYANEGEFLIDIDFPKHELTLLPGMTADVAIQIAVHKDKLRVPVAALSSDTLTILKDHPQQVHVKVGATDGKYAVIESDEIKEGDKLLLKKALGSNEPMGRP